jgi:hypothetical protein
LPPYVDYKISGDKPKTYYYRNYILWTTVLQTGTSFIDSTMTLFLRKTTVEISEYSGISCHVTVLLQFRHASEGHESGKADHSVSSDIVEFFPCSPQGGGVPFIFPRPRAKVDHLLVWKVVHLFGLAVFPPSPPPLNLHCIRAVLIGPGIAKYFRFEMKKIGFGSSYLSPGSQIPKKKFGSEDKNLQIKGGKNLIFSKLKLRFKVQT